MRLLFGVLLFLVDLVLGEYHELLLLESGLLEVEFELGGGSALVVVGEGALLLQVGLGLLADRGLVALSFLRALGLKVVLRLHFLYYIMLSVFLEGRVRAVPAILGLLILKCEELAAVASARAQPPLGHMVGLCGDLDDPGVVLRVLLSELVVL